MTDFASIMYELSLNAGYYKAKNIDKSFKVNSQSKSELSEKQYMTLIVIHIFDVHTVSEMAKLFCRSAGSISLVLSKLEHSDFVQKSYPDRTQDKRRVFFYLTGKGKLAFRVFTDEIIESIETFYKELDGGQKKRFEAGLNNLETIRRNYEQPKIYLDYILESAELEITEKIIRAIIWLLLFSGLEVERDSARLTIQQFYMLQGIYELGLNSITRLSRFISLDESTLSGRLSKLVGSGFLYRGFNQDRDARKIYFYLTEEGEKVYKEMFGNILDGIEKFFSDFQEKELLYEAFKEMNIVFREKRMKQYEDGGSGKVPAQPAYTVGAAAPTSKEVIK